MIFLALRRLSAMFLFLFLIIAVTQHVASSDPVPCDLADPNCSVGLGAPPAESGCDQKCRMRRQFVTVTKGTAMLGIYSYDELHIRWQTHTCDTCKNDASGYCYFSKDTNDTNAEGKCAASTVNNKYQILMSTPLCDLTKWKMTANTGDIIVVESSEKIAKDEDFKIDSSFIYNCQAK
jgi:hypothetical protein